MDSASITKNDTANGKAESGTASQVHFTADVSAPSPSACGE